MSATIIVWIFTMHLCGLEFEIGPYASKAACDAKRALAIKTVLGPQAFGECVKK